MKINFYLQSLSSLLLIMMIPFSSIAESKNRDSWKTIIDFPAEQGTAVHAFREENKNSEESEFQIAARAMYIEGKSIMLSDKANEAWGEPPEVVELYYNEALTEAKSAWGQDHPVTAFISSNFAEYLLSSLPKREAGEQKKLFVQAKSLTSSAHDTFTDRLTLGHPLLARSHYMMARTAYLERRKDQFVWHLQRALPMYKLDPEANAERIGRIESMLNSSK